MGIDRAHIVGVSYSAAVALQLAVLEPPPVHTPSADEFRAANDRLRQRRREQGLSAALDEFLSIVIGPGWRDAIDDQLPGTVAQMERDVATFFDVDLPALLAWKFDAADADRIRCPVLHVGGSDSGPWFAEVRELVRRWLPQAEDVVIAGADHSLALTHAGEIADAVATFLRRHRIGATAGA